MSVNINWRDVETKNVANNVDMSCLRAPWQNGPYKNQHKGRHKNSYNIMTQQTFRKHIFLCFSDFSVFYFLFIDNFLKEFSKKCWVTALVRSTTFIGGLNQFSAIANLTLIEHLLEKKKKINYALTLCT